MEKTSNREVASFCSSFLSLKGVHVSIFLYIVFNINIMVLRRTNYNIYIVLVISSYRHSTNVLVGMTVSVQAEAVNCCKLSSQSHPSLSVSVCMDEEKVCLFVQMDE